MSDRPSAPWIAAQTAELLAQRGHAWLLHGPSGLGQYSLAMDMLRAWLCHAPAAGAGCGECVSCHAITVRTHADLFVLMPETDMLALGWPLGDKAQSEIDDKKRKPSREIRVDAMREAVEFSQRTSAMGRGKAVLVFPAERMNHISANALLKTLEEPPGGAMLILVAADVDALLPTIRSRCQEFTLRPMPHHLLANALIEDAGLDAPEAASLAYLAHGRYGLAMRMHADPTMGVLRASAEAEVARIAIGSRNERFDVSDRLSGGWYRERESVLATLDLWREWWRSALLVGAGVEGAHANVDCNAEEALRALRAVQTAREHLLANTSAQVALDVMMLNLPTLPPGAVTLVHETEDRVSATAGE